MPGTTGMMLCGASQSWQSNFTAPLLGVSGIGAERAVVEVTDNQDAGGWARFIVSCIKRGLPFQITIGFRGSADWKSVLGAAFATWTIVWATETGYSTGAQLSWSIAMTRYTFGGMLQDRIIAVCEVQPTGEPTITAGS